MQLLGCSRWFLGVLGWFLSLIRYFGWLYIVAVRLMGCSGSL